MDKEYELYKFMESIDGKNVLIIDLDIDFANKLYRIFCNNKAICKTLNTFDEVVKEIDENIMYDIILVNSNIPKNHEDFKDYLEAKDGLKKLRENPGDYNNEKNGKSALMNRIINKKNKEGIEIVKRVKTNGKYKRVPIICFVCDDYDLSVAEKEFTMDSMIRIIKKPTKDNEKIEFIRTVYELVNSSHKPLN